MSDWRLMDSAPTTHGIKVIGWCVYPAGAEARAVRWNGCAWVNGDDLSQNVTHWQPWPTDRPTTAVCPICQGKGVVGG